MIHYLLSSLFILVFPIFITVYLLYCILLHPCHSFYVLIPALCYFVARDGISIGGLSPSTIAYTRNLECQIGHIL